MSHITQEKAIVSLMIRIWSKYHQHEKTPSPDTLHLISYAHQRLESCRWGDKKPACKRCPHHCYRPHERQQIRQVMRFSGPRMLWYAPLEALRHWLGRDPR